MKNMNTLAGIFAFSLLAVGCGKTELNDPKMQVTESALSDTSDNDEQLFALSRPIAEKAPAGVIVVEQSTFVLIDNGKSAKPAKKCRLIAGTHLIKVLSGEKPSDFTAVVHYPKGIAFSLNLQSCTEEQRIRITVGSGFKGLAVSKNPNLTLFPIVNPIANPEPVPPPVPCGDGVGVKCLPPIPAPVPCGDGVGVKCLPPTPAPVPCGGGAGVRCLPPMTFSAESVFAPQKACGISIGRRNIRIQDTGTEQLLGTVVSSIGFASNVVLKGECKVGTQIEVDSKSLVKVLSSAEIIPVPGPLYSK